MMQVAVAGKVIAHTKKKKKTRQMVNQTQTGHRHTDAMLAGKLEALCCIR